MAVSDVVAERYAHAAFTLAREADAVAAWRAGLAQAAERVGSEEVGRLLDNPRVDTATRMRIAMAMLDTGPEQVRNLVRLLVERGRHAVLPTVLDAYDRLADAADGRVRAEVTAAVPVDRELEERIGTELRKRLGASVTTTVRQDPAILGGLVIRIGDRVIDGSVRSRLEQLRTALA